MAFSWWAVATSTAAGAGTGALVGSFVPGLGTLVGAGVGALSGFIAGTVSQLFASAPATTQNITLWYVYATDVYGSVVSQSQLIVDNEINQVNLLQESQLPFTLTAQKWEQVNFNANNSPTSPYEFYKMLEDTGFIAYAAKLVGGTQQLWITEQSLINAVNEQIYPHEYMKIAYDNNPNTTVEVMMYYGSSYVVMVVGNVTLYVPIDSKVYVLGSTNGTFTNNTVTTSSNAKNVTLSNGVYVIDDALGSPYLYINPDYGMALIFQYSNGQYSPVQWSYNVPTKVYLYVDGFTNKTTTLPQTSASLPVIAEQVALSMLGAAQVEYTVLNQLGYQNAEQIPSTMMLPTLNLNIGNFTNFTSSLQAYNLYLAMYTRELLQVQQTLQNLSAEGKLQSLQQLNFEATSPLSTYGKYGGFVTNGSIYLPNGQKLNGTFLIQPYGGSLSLSPKGGTVGSGGAVAYSLVPMGNGQYALGTMYVLPPNTTVSGNVVNPGTLSPVAQPQNANYLNVSTPHMPFNTTSSSSLSEIEQYLLSHPLVLIITAFFGLIIIVALIRAIL
jgi:hypothetical protein